MSSCLRLCNRYIGMLDVNETFSDDFLAQVGLDQGSMLSPLLFIIVLEALSRETKSICLEKLPYLDDLVLVKHSGA